MDICYPPDTDWSCKFDLETLADLRADPVSAALIEKSEAFAWSLLASLTAYQIGTCPVTVRPCAASCGGGGAWRTAPVSGLYSGGTIGRMTPYISGGHWFNACGCRSADDCSCTTISEVVLPGPVGAIVSVTIDGDTLPRSAYRVDNGNRLVRQDGEPWPACQDQSVADPGFSVTYYRGAAPNAIVRSAAGAFAAEFYEGCQGNECRLPGNVIRASRGGESFEFEPSDFSTGQTGIVEVDAVIRIYNPYGLKTPPAVGSPDSYARARTTTWR